MLLAASAAAQGFTLTPITGQRYVCTSGQVVTPAGTFPCQNVDLMSFLPLASVGGATNTGGGTANIATTWGWTDPQTGREYAILGRSDGTAFVDVTDPLRPVYLGLLPRPSTRTNNPSVAVAASLWKELKVLNNHVFVVSEATGHGMQTFDLTRLRGVTTPQTFTETGRYTGFGRAHNVLVSEASTTAIATGLSADGTTRQSGCGAGLEFVDVSNPAAPTFAGCYNAPTAYRTAPGYTHDAQCLTYRGPDTRYTGRELCVLSNERELALVDATNKAAIQLLGTATYPNVAYTHQAWLTEDQRYLFLDDEIDETSGTTGGRTRTLIFDVQSLTAPVLAGTFAGRTSAIDHNQYVRGNRLYQANYTAGLAVLDATTPTALAEVGYFDTYPANDNAQYEGIWNVYPYFASGTVVAGGIHEGLFVLRPTGSAVANADAPAPNASALRMAGPNPSSGTTAVLLASSQAGQARVAVFDALGREVLVVFDGTLAAGTHRLPILGGALAAGTYTVRARLQGQRVDELPLVFVR